VATDGRAASKQEIKALRRSVLIIKMQSHAGGLIRADQDELSGVSSSIKHVISYENLLVIPRYGT
jgi:hypothetical protein